MNILKNGMFSFAFAFRLDEISVDIGSKRAHLKFNCWCLEKINNMVLAQCASSNYHLIIETCLCVG